MKNLIINLKPRGRSYHIGDDLKGLERTKEYIHSDTIFSGLMNSFAKLYGKHYVDDLIEQFFDGKPSFVVSSGYLFISGKGYFLPKPKLPIPFLVSKMPKEDQDEVTSITKKYKEIAFFSDLLLKEFLQGISNGNVKLSLLDQIINDAGEYNEAFSSIIRPSASIDRVLNNSELFFRGETFLEKSVNIAVFCKYENDDFAEKLKLAFECLGDLGLGGEKTYGLGQFDVDFIDEITTERKFIFEGINSQSSEKVNLSYLISLYYPTQEELNTIKDSYYSLIERKGWFYSPYTNTQLKRKSVMMLEEGSVISGSSLVGTLVDVSPEEWKKTNTENSHRIVRDGLAFSIPI